MRSAGRDAWREGVCIINMGHVRALSTLRGLRGAPEVPPLCRETQSLGQQMLNALVGINGLSDYHSASQSIYELSMRKLQPDMSYSGEISTRIKRKNKRISYI